jgi:serine/threonine protein kinase
MLTFKCLRCGQLLGVREEFAGRPARCQTCGGITEAPRPAAEASKPPAVLPPAGSTPRGSASGQALADGILAPPCGPGEIGRLGPYRVLRVLGIGAMGVVFEAVDEQLQRPVALKVLLPALAASASARERFLREARAAAAIDHDRVVTIYQVGEDRGFPYLAMQLLQGETLEARLQRELRLPAAEVQRVGREVAEGLAAAHARGLIHRDVKPANIWLESRNHTQPACGLRAEPASGPLAATGGRVKLLDFGLARAAGDSHLTPSGAILGTPAYLAPELAGSRKADARADLFSLGCVLYRCCTGQVPFPGNDMLATLTALATETPRPVRELNPEVSPALSDLVMRLLAKDPDHRPASARAVVETLTTPEPPAPHSAPVPMVEPVDEVDEALPPDDTLVDPALAGRMPAGLRAPARPRRPASGGRLVVLLTGLAALFGLLSLCLAGAGWWALQGGLSEPASSPPLAGKSAPPARWTVLFRSDDPSLWNTETRRGDQFTVPLSQAPPTIHYVRLRRLDTGEALILPMMPGQLDKGILPKPQQGAWWNGTAHPEWGGRHLGIAQVPRHNFPSHTGIISVMNDGWDVFSGSGFGHKCGINDTQYYCWRGQEIPRTVFEIAVTAEPLSDEEQRCLLPQR